MRKPNYSIVADEPGKPLIIRDDGPWALYPTITNNAEEVIMDLWNRGLLKDSRRVFYYDSDDSLDELLHEGPRFTGFAFIDNS